MKQDILQSFADWLQLQGADIGEFKVTNEGSMIDVIEQYIWIEDGKIEASERKSKRGWQILFDIFQKEMQEAEIKEHHSIDVLIMPHWCKAVNSVVVATIHSRNSIETFTSMDEFKIGIDAHLNLPHKENPLVAHLDDPKLERGRFINCEQE